MSILRNLVRGLVGGRVPRNTAESNTPETLASGWKALRSGESKEAERTAEVLIAAGVGDDRSIAGAHWLRAVTRAHRSDFLGALADYDTALEFIAESINCRLGRCAVLHVLERFDEALAAAEEVLEIDPQNKIAHNYRGLMLRELARLDEAETALRRSLQLDPGYHDARANLAMILIEQGRLDDAHREIVTVAAATPQHAHMRWNRATLHLLRGEFAAGWRDYESRIERPEHYGRPYRFPRWSGEALDAGSLLIIAEQGIGDEILFASCFNDAIERAGHCVIECEPRLSGLFARSFPNARVIGSKNEARPVWLSDETRVAAQIEAGSLPGLFRNDVGQFPAHRGYLHADPVRVNAWRARLDALGGALKIGLSWTGGSMKTRRSTRSVPLEQWLPILSMQGNHYVSLQYVDSRKEIAEFAAAHRIQVHDWLEGGTDYEETAALVAALDLVITVTTSLAHLAGALGQRVWVLVPANPEWRYMTTGTGIPWYPSARMFRQTQLCDWSPVIDEVAAVLSEKRWAPPSP